MINNDIADMNEKAAQFILGLRNASLSISSSDSDLELKEELPEEMQYFGTGGMVEHCTDFHNPLGDSDSEKTETADEGSSESGVWKEAQLRVENLAPESVQNNNSIVVQFKLEPDELIIEEKNVDLGVQNGQQRLCEVPERLEVPNRHFCDLYKYIFVQR